MTLNRVTAVILRHFANRDRLAFEANYVELTEARPIVLRQKCRRKILVFDIVSRSGAYLLIYPGN